MLLRIALATCMTAAMFAGDQGTGDKTHNWPRVRFGGFTVNAGYSHFSRGYPWFFPGYYGYPAAWGYSSMLYSPFLWGYVHPGFFTGYGFQPSLGEVRMQGIDRGSWVYIDGALAGRSDKLKTMWLEPGAYQLEIRGANQQTSGKSQKIYVLSGKTLKVTPELMEVR